jgi:hypothetical protein
MGNPLKTYSTARPALAGLVLLTGLTGLAGCTASQPGATGSVAATPSASATATASPTATPTPTPTLWDPAAGADWAAETFPIAGTDQYAVYTNGQLVEARAGGSSMTHHETALGSYELQLACQGGAASSITLDVTSAGGASTRLTAPCDGEIRTSPYAVVQPEVTVAVSGSGEDPVVWSAVLATPPLG